MSSPIPGPARVHHNPRQKRKITWILLAVALGIGLAGLGVILLLYSSLNNAFQESVKLAEGVQVNPSAARSYQLSEDQAKIIDQYGHPDSFTITFYTEEFDPVYSGEVRDETWRYYSSGMEFDFYNGQLMYTNPIPDPPVGWVALPYQPEQFTAYADLETVIASASITDILEFPLEKELIKNGKLYYAPGLSFGTVDGRMIYVETIMMQEEGG